MWRIYWNLCLCQGIFVLGIWMVLHMWRTSAACFRELFSTSLSAKTYLSSRNLTSACDVWRMAVNTAQDGELTRTSAASYLYWSLESRSSQINVLTCATPGNNKMQHWQTLKYQNFRLRPRISIFSRQMLYFNSCQLAAEPAVDQHLHFIGTLLYPVSLLIGGWDWLSIWLGN